MSTLPPSSEQVGALDSSVATSRVATSTATERPRHFLALVLVPSLAGVFAVGAISLAVDPLGLYRLVEPREGFNLNRPFEQGHERVVRAFALKRLAPEAVILGTSRPQVGLEPATLVELGVVGRAANSALSDGTPYEALRYLQHAWALSRPKVAIYSADKLSLLGRRRFAPDFSEDRLATTATLRAQPLWWLADAPATVLSMDALKFSRRTVLSQSSTESYFFEGGRRNPSSMAARIEEQGGARRAFQWSERDYAHSYACARPDKRSEHLADLEALARFASEHGIRLVVLSSPVHARSEVLLRTAMGEELVHHLHREVARIAFAHGAELWEFGGADPRTTGEPVPPLGDAVTRTRWYWESSHYKKELGDVVLRRLHGGETGELAGWGERVTEATLEASMARVDAELATWRARNQGDVAELEALWGEARAAPKCE